MNPTVQGLDPKLKEAYDRVMGTQVSAQPAATQPQVIEPAPAQPAPQETEPAAEHVFVASPTTSSQSFAVKKGFTISPIVWVVLGVFFFAAYSFIWLKVFGIF